MPFLSSTIFKLCPIVAGFNPPQMSTPLPGQNINTTVAQDTQFSPLHNALYLYLARILRPAWSTSIAKEIEVEGKPVVRNISFQ